MLLLGNKKGRPLGGSTYLSKSGSIYLSRMVNWEVLANTPLLTVPPPTCHRPRVRCTMFTSHQEERLVTQMPTATSLSGNP